MNIWYKEFTPSAQLQPYLDSFWYLDFDKGEAGGCFKHRCLPLGMMELIFHIDGEDCYLQDGDNWNKLPQSHVVGIYKDAVLWKTEKVTKFGIRLKPESLFRLFKIPAATLFNDHTDIDTFFGKKVNSLADQVKGIRDPAALIQIAEQFFGNLIRQMANEHHYLLEATNLIRQSKGTITMEELTSNLYVSERQLQRSFKESFGTSPKTYTRIIRFRNAYEYAQQRKGTLSWTDVTYHFGYADQAHFIRDFKEFTGLPPTSILQHGIHFFQMNEALAS